MAAVTICSDFGAQKNSQPLFPHLLSMKWWDQMAWLTVWITTYWKIVKELEIPDYLTCLLRNLYAGQEATKLNMEQRTGSKSRKEYVNAVYCHPAYLTYMQSTSWEMLDWMNHKLESRQLVLRFYFYASRTSLILFFKDICTDWPGHISGQSGARNCPINSLGTRTTTEYSFTKGLVLSSVTSSPPLGSRGTTTSKGRDAISEIWETLL